MAAMPSQIFFCFLVLWHLAFRKAKCYLRIKFRPDISIHGQVITTSGCWRQTSAIFKFYSLFRRTLRRHQHFVIRHWPTKFYANRMIADGVMTSYWFYKMAAVASQIYFRLRFGQVWRLGRSRPIGITNFDQISQSTAEILRLYQIKTKSDIRQFTCTWTLRAGRVRLG